MEKRKVCIGKRRKGDKESEREKVKNIDQQKNKHEKKHLDSHSKKLSLSIREKRGRERTKTEKVPKIRGWRDQDNLRDRDIRATAFIERKDKGSRKKWLTTKALTPPPLELSGHIFFLNFFLAPKKVLFS